jgi:DNA-binding GntR family transcriptional regulator
MPVRDALSRLVADGILELSENFTIRVPKMSNERLTELFEIRSSLEGLATEHATAAIARTEELIETMHGALKNKDYDTYIQSHYSFHFTIYAAANRPTLPGIIKILWLQVGPWFRQGIGRGNIVLCDPNENHRELAGALRARDAERARKVIEKDIFIGTEFPHTGVMD